MDAPATSSGSCLVSLIGSQVFHCRAGVTAGTKAQPEAIPTVAQKKGKARSTADSETTSRKKEGKRESGKVKPEKISKSTDGQVAEDTHAGKPVAPDAGDLVAAQAVARAAAALAAASGVPNLPGIPAKGGGSSGAAGPGDQNGTHTSTQPGPKASNGAAKQSAKVWPGLLDPASCRPCPCWSLQSCLLIHGSAGVYQHVDISTVTCTHAVNFSGRYGEREAGSVKTWQAHQWLSHGAERVQGLV
jgi:hypothetical protein